MSPSFGDVGDHTGPSGEILDDGCGVGAEEAGNYLTSVSMQPVTRSESRTRLVKYRRFGNDSEAVICHTQNDHLVGTQGYQRIHSHRAACRKIACNSRYRNYQQRRCQKC